MKMGKEAYVKYVRARAPKSPLWKDCLHAFWVGGVICVVGQGLRLLFEKALKFSPEDAGMLTSAALIFVAVLLTGFGVFDRIAKYAGAGTLVPITGFANAVVSPAIDSHAEGLVLGVGSKIFTVAGPVLLYGTLAGFLYGLIYRILLLF